MFKVSLAQKPSDLYIVNRNYNAFIQQKKHTPRLHSILIAILFHFSKRIQKQEEIKLNWLYEFLRSTTSLHFLYMLKTKIITKTTTTTIFFLLLFLFLYTQFHKNNSARKTSQRKTSPKLQSKRYIVLFFFFLYIFKENRSLKKKILKIVVVIYLICFHIQYKTVFSFSRKNVERFRIK